MSLFISGIRNLVGRGIASIASTVVGTEHTIHVRCPNIEGGKSAADIVPHDTNVITRTRAIHIGVGGDLKVDFADGGTVTLKVADKSVLYYEVTKVYATGTTATNLVAVR